MVTFRIKKPLNAQLLLSLLESPGESLVHVFLVPRVLSRVRDVLPVLVHEGRERKSVSPRCREVTNTHTRVPASNKKILIMLDYTI